MTAAPTVTNVAFIMYPVADLSRAATFYETVLGFRRAGIESDNWIEYDIDGTTFGIGNFPQVGTPGQAQSLSLEVADMPAFRAALEARGIASAEPYEGAVCFISSVTDPDGNTVYVHQRKGG